MIETNRNNHLETSLWTEKECIHLIKNEKSYCSKNMHRFIWTENTSNTFVVFMPNLIEKYIDNFVWSEHLSKCFIFYAPHLLKTHINKIIWSKAAIRRIAIINPCLLDIENKQFKKVFYNIEEYKPLSAKEFKHNLLIKNL